MKMKVVRVRPQAILPEYQTSGAACADIHACLDVPLTLAPMERAMIPTGLSVAIPEGYEMQLRARSGLSIKHGLTMVNGVGTIDSDFRGEMQLLMINLGQEPFTIEPRMRIAQMVVTRYTTIEWEEVEELDKTARGSGGFGSSGARYTVKD